MIKRTISKMKLHRKLDKRKFLIFLTETPSGEKYLSISKFGKHGLDRRRVFQVCGETDSTPHVDGMTTKRIFL